MNENNNNNINNNYTPSAFILEKMVLITKKLFDIEIKAELKTEFLIQPYNPKITCIIGFKVSKTINFLKKFTFNFKDNH